MESLIQKVQAKYKKSQVVDVQSGDTVKVYQEIVEGSKKRVQMFEGMVIRVTRKGSLTNSITVRKVASGVGVEKSFMLHAPSVVKVEVTKRTKVRRNYLTYMRARSGKSTRLSGVSFDRDAVNSVVDEKAEAELAEAKAQQEAEHAAKAAEEAAAKEAEEAKIAAALANREDA
ncbi:50S ribosomal protein L19 [Candidatus Saccharibacteria bacterium]|nr:50S ribosomal protein L19 [Candidatus Saccharibacteria bacterium]